MSRKINTDIKISNALSEAASQSAEVKGVLLKEMEVVYHEITGKVLDPLCSSCMSTGMKILRNYMTLYPARNAPAKQTNVKRVKAEWKPQTPEILVPAHAEDKPDNQLKLRELRVKYPHIKARSVEGFLLDLKLWEKFND